MHFCDDDGIHPHNLFAPNRQNLLCAYKSVWSVMMQHRDFANGNNPPRSRAFANPTFNLVKNADASYVLVLDISGSMSSYVSGHQT